MKIFGTLLGLLFLSVLTCTGQGNSQVAQPTFTLNKLSEEIVFNKPPFRSAHASTIEQLTPTKFIAASFAGTGEGNKDVCIWTSTFEKGVWSTPRNVANGIINDTLRHPCWNPVLFKEKSGKLFLFYKVGPTPSAWWGMLMTSTDDGKTWSKPEKLPEGIIGPVKNKPVQLANGTILAPSSLETKEANWKVHIEKSTDGGKTWQFITIDPKSEFSAIQPSILIHPDNKLQILCRSKNGVLVQAFSEDNRNTWGPLTKTDLPNPSSGTDAVTLKNGMHVLVYNPIARGRNKLNVAISKDGIKWSDAAILENQDRGEFSYPAVIQAKDGKIHVTYTYNRRNIKHTVLEMVKTEL